MLTPENGRLGLLSESIVVSVALRLSDCRTVQQMRLRSAWGAAILSMCWSCKSACSTCWPGRPSTMNSSTAVRALSMRQAWTHQRAASDALENCPRQCRPRGASHATCSVGLASVPSASHCPIGGALNGYQSDHPRRQRHYCHARGTSLDVLIILQAIHPERRPRQHHQHRDRPA